MVAETASIIDGGRLNNTKRKQHINKQLYVSVLFQINYYYVI
jgi:hypothetical protein